MCWFILLVIFLDIRFHKGKFSRDKTPLHLRIVSYSLHLSPTVKTNLLFENILVIITVIGYVDFIYLWEDVEGPPCHFGPFSEKEEAEEEKSEFGSG